MAAFLFRAIPGQPLAITSAALPAGQVGDAYSATLEASGGTPPYVWSADGLPSGLNIDQPSGVISGTPTEAGTFPVEFTVTDSRGTSVTETLNLVVREPAPGPDPGGEDDSAGGEDDPGNGEEPDIELEYSSFIFRRRAYLRAHRPRRRALPGAWPVRPTRPRRQPQPSRPHPGRR